MKLNRLQVTGFDPSRHILFKNSLFAFLIVVTVQILTWYLNAILRVVGGETNIERAASHGSITCNMNE